MERHTIRSVTLDGTVRPNAWLRQLTRLKPASWPKARCVRTALAIALPILLGMMLDSPATFMMMSLGALGLCLGERDGPYLPRFKEILIVAPIGAIGFFLGYLGDLPWGWVVACMTLAAFVAGIVSSFGSAFSAGTVQGLLMGCIAIAIPAIAPYWQPALFFLAGCGFYALLLGIEALLYRQRPFINEVASLLDDIAKLATARSRGITVAGEASYRRAVTDKLSAAYGGLLSSRYRHQAGRSPYLDWEASVLQGVEHLFSATLASKIPENLTACAQELREIARQVRLGKSFSMAAVDPNPAGAMLLPRALANFRQIFWLHASSHGMAERIFQAPGQAQPRRHFLDRLAVAPQTIKTAAILALCIGLAFATRWFNDGPHWYWTPLTVIIVLKPELGSIFARTVLRMLGTIVAVAAGALIFALVPKGMGMVCVLALLAALLPWAVLRSYGFATFCATLVVLILLDEIAPGIRNIDYGLARLVDTVWGGVIILVFGYFLWPRSHAQVLTRGFQEARSRLAQYLLALRPEGDGGVVPGRQTVTRRQVYVALATMRGQLQNAMQEPPPAGPEAAAWFPLVTSAEQLCDDISAWAIKHSIAPGAQAEMLTKLAAWVSGEAHGAEDLLAAENEQAETLAGLNAIVCEWLAQIERLTEPQSAA